MDYLKSIFFLFLFSNSVFAGNLCDSSCELTITFPDGGSIEAVEALTLSFGTGGSLNLGETGTINTAIQPSSTNYSLGGMLTLAAGESITFDNGGLLDLGTGGNLDYSNIAIQSNGEFILTAVGGDEEITLSTTTATGTFSLNLVGSAITAVDSLNITGSLFLNTSTVDSSINCASDNITTSATFNISNSSLTSEAASSILGPCNLINPDLDISSLSSTTDLTSLVDGITEFSVIINNETCIIKLSNLYECKTDSGLSYEFINGEWVSVDETGVINLLLLFFLSSLTLSVRSFKKPY